jgi:hypothetical protein
MRASPSVELLADTRCKMTGGPHAGNWCVGLNLQNWAGSADWW